MWIKITKRCFRCNRRKFLFLFKRIKKGRYARESEKGRLIVCRKCSLKRSLSGEVVRRIEPKGFEVVKYTKIEALKDYFSRY